MAGPIRVLVVEDDPTQRELLGYLLEGREDMALCGAAGDGLTGLDLALSLTPDVILLDLILPGISGLELLRRYRAGGGSAGVLVVTRAAGETASSAAMAAGADFYLVKPVQHSELINDIRMLGGGTARRCQELLLEMAALESWLGFRYAARFGSLLAEGKCRLLKEGYYQITMEEHTTYACVEKNIRKLIEQVHEVKAPRYRELFPGGKRPSNGEFLRALARAARIPL